MLAYLKPYRLQMTFAALALLLSTGAGLAFPALIVRLLDSVTQTRQLSALNWLAATLIGIFLLQAAFQFVQSYLLAAIGERMVVDLRNSLYSHLQQLSLDFYADRRVGDLVSRLSSDVTQMRTMLTNNITGLLSQILTLVGSIAIVLQPMNRSLCPVHAHALTIFKQARGVACPQHGRGRAFSAPQLRRAHA